MRELLGFLDFGPILLEVLIAIVPLLIIFIIFQIFFLRLPWESILIILRGIFLTILGLILFLQGVKVGFLPTGSEVGRLLGTMSYKWLNIPLGFCFGLVATLAEPAVRIMSYEIEKASSEATSSRIIFIFISFGVAFFCNHRNGADSKRTFQGILTGFISSTINNHIINSLILIP